VKEKGKKMLENICVVSDTGEVKRRMGRRNEAKSQAEQNVGCLLTESPSNVLIWPPSHLLAHLYPTVP
jgi:hypothetical protein